MEMTPKELSDIVRQTSYDIQSYLGYGLFEKIYENALVSRLRKLGVKVEQQVSLEVCDQDGTLLGSYIVDVLVEGYLLLELKSVRALNINHQIQIMGYMRAMKLTHGLLINFGSARFEMKKYIV